MLIWGHHGIAATVTNDLEQVRIGFVSGLLAGEISGSWNQDASHWSIALTLRSVAGHGEPLIEQLE